MEVVGQWLQNLLDPDVVNSVVAPDATYVSLNTENAELKKIMPLGGHVTRPAGVPRERRRGVHRLGEPSVQRGHDVRLRRAFRGQLTLVQAGSRSSASIPQIKTRTEEIGQQ